MNNLFRIFYAPGDVFAGIPEKSLWYLPFTAALLISCLASAMIVNSIGMENLIRRQLQAQPRLAEQLGEEKIKEITRQANSPAQRVSAYISGMLGTGVVILVVASILTALLYLIGYGAGFRNVFSVTSYSYFVYHSVLLAVSALMLLVISDKESLDPSNLLLSHAGAFFDQSATNKALFSLASSLDFFSFWLLFLIALGLSKVSRRITFARSALVVAGLWAGYVAVKAGFSLLF